MKDAYLVVVEALIFDPYQRRELPLNDKSISELAGFELITQLQIVVEHR